MTLLTTMEYLCHKWPHIYSPCRKHFPVRPHSIFITGFVTRLTRRVPLVEQELLTLPEHMSSPPVFSGVRVTRSLVVYVCFVDRRLSFCSFSFGQCVFCSSLLLSKCFKSYKYKFNLTKSLKIPKRQSESVYQRRTENTLAKRKRTKGQTAIHKAYIYN
jgi:hypothetical protein